MRNNIFSILFFISSICLSCSSNNEKKVQKSSSENVENKTTIVENQKKIIFFGNSLTAGYGLEKENAFPAVIQRHFDSLKIDYKCINAGLSGETTAGGNERINWVLQQNKPDIFVLSLGGNDALRGISISNTKANLENIINSVRKKYPKCKILLAGIVPPPNMGNEYFNTFKEIFPAISKEKDTFLLNFLLEGVAGDPNLNQEDGIHPNKKGAVIVANNVIKALDPLL